MPTPAHYPLSGAPSYALTKGPQVYRLMNPVSQADLMEQIVSALLAAYHPGPPAYGWTLDSDITNGHRLKVKSPQNFEAFVDVYWALSSGGRNLVAMKWRSSTGSGAVGMEYVVDYQNGRQFQIVANPAGFFLSRPNIVYAGDGTVICGSIPFVDDGCGFGADPVTEIWWSMGDSHGGTAGYDYARQTPRLGLDNGGGGTLSGNLPDSKQGVLNGSIVTGQPIDPGGRGTPQILRISSGALDDDGNPGGSSSHPVWVDGVPILYPAFIGWGDPVSTGLRIRGQIYDAICRSKGYPMDTTETWDDFDWINFTDKYFFGSLWLITGAGATSASILNVAY